MKVMVTKVQGGILVPMDDHEAEKLKKLKNNEDYEANIPIPINPKFRSKIHVFFKFCFDHWDGNKIHPHCTELEQRERFRKDLTILAGFKVQTIRLDGTFRTEAKSLAFENMEEDEFSECYHAVIQAAMSHVFRTDDESYYNKLKSFF